MSRRALSSAFSLGLLAIAASLAPTACAEGTTVPTASTGTGSGGSGGEGTSTSSTSTSSSSSSGSGPCISAQDCAAFSDPCNAGTCINGECTKQPANEGASCDDGKQCTLNDFCQNGACTGTPKPCPASDSCHLGFCDTTSDACTQIPGNDGSPCVDNDACTLTGKCQGGVCNATQMIDCSFLDTECSVGFCDPMLGCKVMPINDGTPCNDGFYCTVNDVCQGGLCTGDPRPCVPPGDVCKIGVCNEAQKTCVTTPGNNGAACDDLNACTSGETCSNGLCGGGQPANMGGTCDDHDACTTVDTCGQNGQCVGSAPITQCVSGDGCCPSGCSLADDTDCIPPCCGDDQNPFPLTHNCFQGATWIAWQYVPTCSFNMTRLEIASDSGSVALLTDQNGKPGAVLFQSPLSPTSPVGWLGADASPPVALTGGQVYWIAEAVGECSVASGGVMQPYYGSFGGINGPWDGPFSGHNWTSHVIGECGP